MLGASLQNESERLDLEMMLLHSSTIFAHYFLIDEKILLRLRIQPEIAVKFTYRYSYF